MTVHDDDVPLSDQPALDELLGALRQPARPDELAGEQEAVGALAAAVESSRQKGPVPVRASAHTRKLAAVAVGAALIVGGVTAAAASVFKGPNGPSTVIIPSQTPSTSTSSTVAGTSTSAAPTTSTTAASTTSSSVAESTTTSSVAESTTSSVPDTTPPAIICPEDVENHGDFVSGVAHETPPGPGHGDAVSEAAKSDCGKKDKDATEADDDDNSTPPSSQDATRAGGNGNGHNDADDDETDGDQGGNGNQGGNGGNGGNGGSSNRGGGGNSGDD
jgi:uncharacterized membrane protein YgcG